VATISIQVDISYGQLAVFWSSLSQPFNDWKPEHVDQGFAWRPGSVSFRTLKEFGPHSVQVIISDVFGELADQAVRVIDVPFEVPDSGDIEIASISDSVPLSLPAGKYCLRCEFHRDNSPNAHTIKLIFAKSEDEHFSIVRADAELIPKQELVMSAEPAAT
jgi:hypothetical protein